MIDCGGGTVDISAFEVRSSSPPSLEQLGEASGGPWGSTNVDTQFEGYLKASLAWPYLCPQNKTKKKHKTRPTYVHAPHNFEFWRLALLFVRLGMGRLSSSVSRAIEHQCSEAGAAQKKKRMATGERVLLVFPRSVDRVSLPQQGGCLFFCCCLTARTARQLAATVCVPSTTGFRAIRCSGRRRKKPGKLLRQFGVVPD